MSKITRISAALALMVAVVSGCKNSNNTYPDGGPGCACNGTPGPISTGVGTPVSTPHAPIGMTSPTVGGAQVGSPMPTGSSFAPTTTGMGGGQYPGR